MLNKMQPAILQKALAEYILETLENIPESDWQSSQRNVPGMQITLGLLVPQHEYGNIPLPTVKTFKFPGLAALLLQYFRRTISGSSKYMVTNIQITKDLRSPEHVDANNRGPSHIVTFVTFTGGET